ncbi:MAG: diaminopimelate decarboxylase [Vampirovibrionales bacterium]|nr:diaminopimelate decarboxylase [Vampirovibrionales bacterium]
MTANQSITPLTYAINDQGHSCVGGVDLTELAAAYGTPLYALDAATFRAMAAAYHDALENHYPKDALALYAAKANLSMGLCKLADNLGLGLDVVSGGELYTAVQAGFPVEKVFFNGNNKSADEIELALQYKVGRITVDNPDELALIHEVASRKGVRAEILLRISPGIECHTHDYIKTGQLDSKFGFHLGELSAALDAITTQYRDTMALKGLHAHIGSQIFETRPYEDLVETMFNIYYNIRASYGGLILPDLNLGGGLGVAYQSKDDPLNIEDAVATICQKAARYAEKLDYPLPRLLLEPGRSMVATAGITLYTVGTRKTVPGVRKYVSVDGGMGDNIRPALYQAEYSATLANKAALPVDETVTIAGKYCESGDVLIRKLEIPTAEPGDVLAVFGTGAYNYSMASTYNRVPRPAMVLLENGAVHLLVRRETYDHLSALDVIPSYLMNPDPKPIPLAAQNRLE